MLLDVFHPVIDVLERILVGHVVREDDAVCTLVVRFRDDVKFLLARSVPKLYLDSLPAVINMLGFEIDPEAKKMR